MKELKEESQKEYLKRLGLKGVAKKVDKVERMKKAYSNYLFITQGTIDKFNTKLRIETVQEDERTTIYKRLVFIALESYEQLPPDYVLEALEKAKEDECFDTFEVAKIEWIKEIKDPILFGIVEGCSDKFFVSQWNDDVKIEDLMFMEK